MLYFNLMEEDLGCPDCRQKRSRKPIGSYSKKREEYCIMVCEKCYYNISDRRK